MSIKIICCLSLIMMMGSVATAQCNGGLAATVFVNWSQFHFDPCHTAYNPYEFVLSPTTVGNLVLRWEHMMGVVASSPAGGQRRGLRRVLLTITSIPLSASTGALLWQFRTGALSV